jgi:ABC-2 type transport system ATP-binding protein
VRTRVGGPICSSASSSTRPEGAHLPEQPPEGALVARSSDVELLIRADLGLDPLMAETFKCIEEKGTPDAPPLSSHILAEVEALCDRVTIIRDGRAVETGALSDLRHLTRTSITAELAGAPTGLAEIPGVHDVRLDGGVVHCQVDTAELAR